MAASHSGSHLVTLTSVSSDRQPCWVFESHCSRAAPWWTSSLCTVSIGLVWNSVNPMEVAFHPGYSFCCTMLLRTSRWCTVTALKCNAPGSTPKKMHCCCCENWKKKSIKRSMASWGYERLTTCSHFSNKRHHRCFCFPVVMIKSDVDNHEQDVSDECRFFTRQLSAMIVLFWEIFGLLPWSLCQIRRL